MHPYEARFANQFGPEYFAFGFWKARVALYAILKAMDFGAGDEVILPGYTCVVVPNSVLFAGATPIYADISSRTFNIDPASVAKLLRGRSRAIIAQHTYGFPADMAALRAIAEERGLLLIEDCAHVLVGSTYQGKRLGTLGDASFFSFQWSKPYTTGLGGMVVTKNPELADKLQKLQSAFALPPDAKQLQLRLQYQLYHLFFRPAFFWWSQKTLNLLSRFGLFVGSSSQTELAGKKPIDYNWKMAAFQENTGLAELQRLDANLRRRRTLARIYSAALPEPNGLLAQQVISPELTLLRFPWAVEKKTALLKQAQDMGIELGSWFETPLHPIPLEQHSALGYDLGSCPIAEAAARKIVNLPLHDRVTEADAERIVQFVATHGAPARKGA